MPLECEALVCKISTPPALGGRPGYTLRIMSNYYEKRRQGLINSLRRTLWPVLKFIFKIKVEGLDNVPNKGPLLFIANHNVGALLESHSSLFILQERIPNSIIYGFTHPSLFRVTGIKQYFEWIGAVPATYEVAAEVFHQGNSLMIFPGGNRQALRSIWNYKKNQFEESHGWAKIATTHNVPVVPITFRGSHFVNPILLSGEWVSKLLVLPWILGLKWGSISLGQILLSALSFFLLKNHVSLALNLVISYLIFIFTPLALLVPYPITMKVHKPIYPKGNQEELEKEMNEIMGDIYS